MQRTNNNSNEPFLSLSHFDNELQQQAQFVIQQNMQHWQEFNHYAVAYDQPTTTSPLNSCHSIPSPVSNDKIRLGYATASPDTYMATQSPPFDSPGSMIQQEPSPLSTFESRNITPLQSPKHEIVTNSTLQFQVNDKTSSSSPPQQKKSAHNAIERRYRNNINDRITELKNAVPALVYAKVKDSTGRKRNSSSQDNEDEDDDGQEYLDGVAVATKLNKATILRKATEYIVHLKHKEDDMKQENCTLQRLLSQLPGGYDVLNRYQTQKRQRDQEVHRQRVQERAVQKKKQQQRKKRSRHTSPDSMNSDNNTNFFMPIQHHQSHRIFMTVFMAITFFAASPVSMKPHHDTLTSQGFGVLTSWSSTIYTIICVMLLVHLLWFFLYKARRRIPKKPKNNIHFDINETVKKIDNCFKGQNCHQVTSNSSNIAFAWFRHLVTSIRSN